MLKWASQLLYLILGPLFLMSDMMISVILELNNLQWYRQEFASIYISYPFRSRMASSNCLLKELFAAGP